MKFNQSLKFNAVADWWNEYISYGYLKKQIYLLEKQLGPGSRYRDRTDLEANEHETLLGHGDNSTDHYFRPFLDSELAKITTFYETQEGDLFDDLAQLDEQIEAKDAQGLRPEGVYADDESEEYDIDDLLSPNIEFSQSRSTRRMRSGSYSKSPITSARNSQFIDRRYSTSSSEDGGGFAASMGSSQLVEHVRPIPEAQEGGSSQTLHQQNPSPQERPLGGVSSTVGSKSRLSRIFKSLVPGEHHIQTSESVWTARTNYAVDTRALFKRRITNVFLSFTSLRSYVELNYTGFRKILKKYDKVTYSELKDPYMHDIVEQAYPFLPSTRDKLREAVVHLIALYAKCVTKGDVAMANKQLRVHQREHVAWERDTVWRQMIGNERHAPGTDAEDDTGEEALPGSTSSNYIIKTPLGDLKFRKKKLFFPVAVAAFIAVLLTKPVEGVEANNCFSILVLATLLWATEAIPLFVTSLFVPLLLVMLRTIRSSDGTHTRLSTPEATKFIFSVMFSPTIMLLIGGFTIASAISKTSIDRVLITRVLNLAGTRPNIVLLAFMGVACFASMWISNVAAPTLCFTLIQPILRTLPPKTSFAPCLILGIALAANIGGQSSPISSPQNLIAIEYMNPRIDWLSWFAVAIPVSFISIVLIWFLLLVSYRPSVTADGEPLEIRPIRPSKEKFTLKQWWVTVVCLLTIGLWCGEHAIEDKVGDMGVIAIFPIVAFFSTGVLKKEDFEQFLWTIVFLAMGGIALGKAVDSSGLLVVLDEFVRGLIDGLSLFGVVVVLSVVVLVISTFISHTIASVLLVPIAAEVGAQFAEPHPNLLIFITALICSTGMGMPVSGFPNQTAANQVDGMGKLYLTNIDFLKNGVPASIIATMIVSSVGYSIMRLIGL